ncbi:BamA/TamA family outer membrane protein [bacterium]|nr:BamA/TamA family outer membrane protein [bacterium]
MAFRILPFFIFLFFLHDSWASIIGDRKICGSFFLRTEGLFDLGLFSSNDLLLICGDPSVSGWENVPKNQSIYQIKTILRSKGHFKAEIIEEEDKTIVRPGEKSFIRKVIFRNDPPGFKDIVFRGYENQAITPAALEKAKEWTRSRLRALGYACPKVHVKADPIKEELYVEISAGRKLKLVAVQRPRADELKPSAFERKDAFKVGQTFNGDLLALTSRRLTESDVAQFAYFDEECDPEGVRVDQKVTLAPPRTFLISFGASTEELPIFQAEWKNSRLDDLGTNLSFKLYASPRKQSIKAQSQLYWFESFPEFFLLPSAEVRRESEPTYEILSQHFQWGLGHTNDDSRHRYAFGYTPSYTIEKTLDGEGPDNIQFFSFKTQAQMTSHYFEFYKATPQEGYELSIGWEAQREGVGSPLSLDLFNFSGTYLMNLGKWDPPLTVLGFRFSHDVALSSDLNEIPTSYRLFLGGAENIRGFSRKSINNDNQGYLTTSYLGVEARFLEVLPYKVQPFVFMDAGKVSQASWTFGESTYTSPGVGVRWQSPLGALRGTVAKGRILNKEVDAPQPKEEWNFYLSYGQEF